MSRKRKRTGQAKKPISPFPLIGRSHYLHVAMVRIQLPLCFFIKTHFLMTQNHFTLIPRALNFFMNFRVLSW